MFKTPKIPKTPPPPSAPQLARAPEDEKPFRPIGVASMISSGPMGFKRKAETIRASLLGGVG